MHALIKKAIKQNKRRNTALFLAMNGLKLIKTPDFEVISIVPNRYLILNNI